MSLQFEYLLLPFKDWRNYHCLVRENNISIFFLSAIQIVTAYFVCSLFLFFLGRVGGIFGGLGIPLELSFLKRSDSFLGSCLQAPPPQISTKPQWTDWPVIKHNKRTEKERKMTRLFRRNHWLLPNPKAQEIQFNPIFKSCFKRKDFFLLFNITLIHILHS